MQTKLYEFDNKDHPPTQEKVQYWEWKENISKAFKVVRRWCNYVSIEFALSVI